MTTLIFVLAVVAVVYFVFIQPWNPGGKKGQSFPGSGSSGTDENTNTTQSEE